MRRNTLFPQFIPPPEQPPIRLLLKGGTLSFPQRTVELDVRGVDWPVQVSVDGQATDEWEHTDRRLTIRLPASRAARTLEVRSRVAM
jgi:hypothetical protein